MTQKRLKEGAIDTILNSVSIFGEMVDDFRNSDKFFKYKAMVVATWFILSLSSLVVACPANTGGVETNDIGAQLLENRDEHPPVYTVKNDSADTWNSVVITVNGRYKSTLNRLEGNGGTITLTSAVLFDEQGTRPSSKLVIQDIRVTVDDPSADFVMLKHGLTPD